MLAVWVTFAQEVTDIPWRKLCAAVRDKAKAEGLATENPMQGIAVQIPIGGQQAGQQPVVSQSSEAGYEFMRYERPDAISEKITLTRNVIRYENWAYTRWVPFKARAQAFLDVALPHFASTVQLQRISSEYVDQFQGAPGKRPDCSSIIDANSKSIASSAFQAALPWHSHNGWFELPDNESKRLVNVDVTVGDAPHNPILTPVPTPVIQIRTHLTDFFNQPDTQPLSLAVDWSLCDLRLQSQHDKLKTLLKSVLTDDAKTSISLS